MKAGSSESGTKGNFARYASRCFVISAGGCEAPGFVFLDWLSLPTRRHSQEIEKNNKIAVAIAVKFDKNPIIGIQAEGTAEVVKNAETVKKIMPTYIEKYGNGKDFYELFKSGKNEHWLYKFTPRKYFLLDEINFNDGQKHQWAP
jgi:predicted nucleotidyltransferase component of viral defense system